MGPCSACSLCSCAAPLRCSACLSVWYCSKDHQRHHWPRHRPACRVLCSFSRSSPDFLDTRLALKRSLENKLCRPLDSRENRLWMFPRCCSLCFDFKISDPVECKLCYAVVYCSDEHRVLHGNIHGDVCSAFKLQYDFSVALSRGGLCSTHGDVHTISKNLQCIFDPGKVLTVEDVNRTHNLSHVVTVLHVLELLNIVSDSVISDSRLIIHVIGASTESFNLNRYFCEILFHSIVNLQNLSIYFIGPESQTYSDDSWKLCSDCEMKQVSITFHDHSLLYKDCCEKYVLEKPTLRIVFNCGFTEGLHSENHLWKDSFHHMLKDGYPLAFTSYTFEEAVQDLSILEESASSGLNVIIRNKTNPFKSFLPLRDWVDVNKIYFNNNYFSIVRKKLG